MASSDDGRLVVTAIADVETAHRMARSLEDSEALRLGASISKARAVLARKLGCSPGTLESIRRLRSKVIPSWLMARIRAALIAELHSQIRQLEHEISIHQQVGSHHSDDDVRTAQAALAAAKAALGVTPSVSTEMPGEGD